MRFIHSRRFPQSGPLGGLAVHCPLLLFLFFAAVFVRPTFAADDAHGVIRAHGLKIVGNETHTRLLLYFEEKPQTNWFLLRDPHRLVIDLPQTKFELQPDELEPRGLISHIRYGNLNAGKSRMILSIVGPFVTKGTEVLANEASPGYRMIVDISAASAKEFNDALRARMHEREVANRSQGVSEPAEKAADNRFTIVIDAGHGGIDSGARGMTGTLEKTITLAFALELRRKLQESGNYNVVMTRDKDIFLRLDERVRIAREQGADLFLSIHADAIHIRGVRGATVYTESDRASDAKAAATAARENLSDELAGIEVEEERDEVADILVDLLRRETRTFSNRFANSLLARFSDTINLVSNPHRYAGFRVLRAPDVPSVLIELGYLSNPQDEKLLRSPEWRGKAVESIAEAVAQFAAVKSAGG